MMPPTGLTIFIHATVILLKKMADRMHRPFCEKTYEKETTRRQAITSFFIMSIVFSYVFLLVAGFIYRAAVDDHATWKIVRRMYDATHLRHSSPLLPIYFDSIAVDDPPATLFLSLNRLPVTQKL